MILKKKICFIQNQQRERVGQAKVDSGVYESHKLQTEQTLATTAMTSSEIWHLRLGHINRYCLSKIKNGAVEGLSYLDRADIDKSACTI